MSRRKTKPTWKVKSFESVTYGETTGKESFVRVFESMMNSDAWKELTGRQRSLYLFCKGQYTKEYDNAKSKPVEGTPYYDNTDIAAYREPEIFYMNREKVKECRLYNRTDWDKVNRRDFYRDMQALLQCGFIECLETGRITRTKSIYKMSEKWKGWKKE